MPLGVPGAASAMELPCLGPEDHRPGQIDQWVAHRRHFEVDDAGDIRVAAAGAQMTLSSL